MYQFWLLTRLMLIPQLQAGFFSVFSSWKFAILSWKYPGFFLQNLRGHPALGFSEFIMVLETLIELCMTELIFLGNFCPKNWGNGPKTGQNDFLNLNKNLFINFHLICSVMKIYNTCSVPAQILHLGKILFLRYRPKCSESFRLQDF